MRQFFIKKLANLKLAIIILLLIATFSILGTIIEQNQSKEFYVINYTNLLLNTNIPFSKIILNFGLNHVYSTTWYLSLLFLFGSCLICCTLIQQIPLLKNAKKCQFQITEQEFKKQSYSTILTNKQFISIFERLRLKQFIIFQQKQTFYAYKGLLGRFAPIVVHFSMIIILIGTTIAALSSFNAQELQPKGEVFQLQNIVSQGPLTPLKKVPFRINDFWVEYGETEKVKQFYTDFSILDNRGNEVKQKTISVNYPLRYKNLTIYQTDWDLVGLRLNINDETYQIPLTSLNNKKVFWVGWFPLNKDQELTFIINKLNGEITIYNNRELLRETTLNSKIPLLSNFKIQEIIAESGLQIKTDLGVPLIYTGFGLLMISSLLSYISYTQLWFLKNKYQILMSGKTNRALLNLRLEFSKFQKSQ